MPCDLTLAFYIRLSSEDGDLFKNGKDESFSVGHQRLLLRDYYKTHPELHKYKVIEFVDDGYTGTNFNRPRFQDMMAMIRRKELHCVMVKDLSRMGRDVLEVGSYLELIFPLFGTRFISVNDQFDSDSFLGTTGGIDLAFRNLINGLYSKDLSIKIRSAIVTRQKQGAYWGGDAFYGYLCDPKDKHRLIKNPEVSSVVVRIFNECLSGLTLTEIARKLNVDGIPSPAEYKRLQGKLYNGRVIEEKPIWVATTIRRILVDERYTGKMIANKREPLGMRSRKTRAVPKSEWIIVEGTHEAIISQEVFDAAQMILSKRCKSINRNTAGRREDNLFVCGHCGRKLQKSFGRVNHLFCGKSLVVPDVSCAHLHEPIDAVQNTTLEMLTRFATTFSNVQEEMLRSIDHNKRLIQSKIQLHQSILDRQDQEKLEQYEAYRSGTLSREAFLKKQQARQATIETHQEKLSIAKKKLSELNQQAVELASQTAQLSSIENLHQFDPVIVRKFIKQIKVFSNGTLEYDFAISGAFVDRVKSLTFSAPTISAQQDICTTQL